MTTKRREGLDGTSQKGATVVCPIAPRMYPLIKRSQHPQVSYPARTLLVYFERMTAKSGAGTPKTTSHGKLRRPLAIFGTLLRSRQTLLKAKKKRRSWWRFGEALSRTSPQSFKLLQAPGNSLNEMVFINNHIYLISSLLTPR